MVRFAHPEYLYALVLVPVIVLLYMVMRARYRKNMRVFGENQLMDKLAGDTSRIKPLLKMILFCSGLSLLIIGWSNPQIGTKLETVKREGVDIIIALDVSNSMKAEDIRPNRLERAKQVISRLVDRLENDRIGLIVFAGEAYVQLPITSDYSAAKLFLSSIDCDMVPTQGTAIGAAIDLSTKSFVGNDNKHKALIIISDGENHEDDAVEAAKKANAEGIIINTIGMGSPSGAPIPVYKNGVQVDFFKDREGKPVLSRLDEATLQEIAAAGKGTYLRATNADDGLNTILEQIGKMEKKEFGTKQFTDYEDRFQYFLAGGLLLIILQFLITGRKSRLIQRMDLFRESEKPS